jgi:hypothetical protein
MSEARYAAMLLRAIDLHKRFHRGADALDVTVLRA